MPEGLICTFDHPLRGPLCCGRDLGLAGFWEGKHAIVLQYFLADGMVFRGFISI